jgi:hypothetical protein
MIESPEPVKQLVVEEVNRFRIVKRDFLLPYLLTPMLHLLNWSYSAEPISYPGWLVADLQERDLGIFYSVYGHGKHDPWGTISISRKQFGMDDRWFLSLEDAVIHSGC